MRAAGLLKSTLMSTEPRDTQRLGFTFRRYDPVTWRITRTEAPYWFSFRWEQDGGRAWEARVGLLTVGWR